MAIKTLKGCGVLKVDDVTIELNDTTNVISVKDGVVALPEATPSVLGGVLQATNQADSTATTVELLLADFNALLLKLKTAGIMEVDV